MRKGLIQPLALLAVANSWVFYSTRAQTTSCGGHDEAEHHCPADTSRGVTLLQERGTSRCIRGYSWDYVANEIWVDHGCAAEFALVSRKPVAWQEEVMPPGKYLISCAAPAAIAVYCAQAPQLRAELVRQTSDARCVNAKRWGVDSGGLWVSNGCAGDFVVMQREQTEPGTTTERKLVECDSTEGKRNFCQADARGGAVLRATLGHRPCDFGESWDYNEGGVWVDRGCRGVFEVEGASETGTTSGTIPRCYLTVGEALAAEWEAECYALRPGHFASCNANQSCADLTATTRKACKAKGGAAPDYCEKYLPDDE